MSKNNTSGGVGIFGIVGIVFIILKLVGVINWSWIWVLSPFWIGFLFWAIIIIIVLLVVLIKSRKEK